MTIKNLKYVKINSVNPLYLIFSKVNGYFNKEINKIKYLTLIPTMRANKKFKSKIQDLIRSIAKNSDDYDEKYMKIKFNLDDELPLDKTIEICSMIITVRAYFFKKITNIIHKFL